MAIATEDVSKTETQKLEGQLRPELEENKNISILVLESPKAGESVFSLSNILNNWLEAIQDGRNSIIAIIEAIPITPAKMARQLEQAIRNLWMTLSAV